MIFLYEKSINKIFYVELFIIVVLGLFGMQALGLSEWWSLRCQYFGMVRALLIPTLRRRRRPPINTNTSEKIRSCEQW